MIKIYIIWDSFKHFENAIKEYEKRLSKEIKIFKIKPHKNWNREQIIEKDTEKINKLLQKEKNSYNILLSLQGKELDSLEFANLLKDKLDKWININFIIWWAFWLNEEKLENIHFKIKLWKITLPHWLALLVLIEQIYRSFQINKNRNYHY